MQKLNRRNAQLPLAKHLIALAERGILPDFLVRFGVRRLCRCRLKNESIDDPESQQKRFQDLIEQLQQSPIAIQTDAANEQHYQVPTEFYLATLGKHSKYSCAYYATPTHSLDEAEEAMLNLYSERAQLDNGQQILELGCGWGSLTLWMAKQYPQSHITAVSNSSTQKQYIQAQCTKWGLNNVTVITADMNELTLANNQFDRAISIEMFEHMRNYQVLLNHISNWLTAEGTLFVHIFAHRTLMYPFESHSAQDWMSKYFFTGGLMPSVDTLLYFQEHLHIKSRWLVNGTHYQRTCNHWLEKMDANKPSVMHAFRHSYGADQAKLWFHRWRIFYMACAELFGFNEGNEWLVAHYLFENSPEP